jgi:hypothetical protein
MSALIIRKYFPIGFLFDKIIRLLWVYANRRHWG